MMEYTKGPWTWNEDEAAVVAGTPEKGKIICYPEKYSKKEFYGNKNLIQAAPDMYETLRSIIYSGEIPYCESDKLVIMAKQALTKAEGKEVE